MYVYICMYMCISWFQYPPPPPLFTYLGRHFKYRQTMSAIIVSHHPHELPECYFLC